MSSICGSLCCVGKIRSGSNDEDDVARDSDVHLMMHVSDCSVIGRRRSQMGKACSRTVATWTRTTIANKNRKIMNTLESSDDDDDAGEDCVVKMYEPLLAHEPPTYPGRHVLFLEMEKERETASVVDDTLYIFQWPRPASPR